MRGEFRSKSGLILPNNLSLAGSKAIITAWAQNVAPNGFYLGLVKGTPTPTMTLNDMIEPTVGVNGYSRKQVTRDTTGWPDFGNVGSENFIGTQFITWTPVGGAFDKVITRVALFDTNVVDPTNPVIALSSPLPADFTIDLTTAAADRTFQYRLYL